MGQQVLMGCESSTYALGLGRYFYIIVAFKSYHTSFLLKAIVLNGFIFFQTCLSQAGQGLGILHMSEAFTSSAVSRREPRLPYFDSGTLS